MRSKRLANWTLAVFAPLLLIACTAQDESTSSQPGAGKTPLENNCTTVINFAMFVPAPTEVCPDPPEVAPRMSQALKAAAREYGSSFDRVEALKQSGLSLGCVEVWSEKWIDCSCQNLCVDPEFWECDCPHTEFGQLPDTDGPGFPVAIEVGVLAGKPCSAGATCNPDGGNMPVPSGNP
jgi:hypothetical protein